MSARPARGRSVSVPDYAAFRRASLYVTALWGLRLDVQAHTTPAALPVLASTQLSLPETSRFLEPDTQLARAAATHSAAHLVYGAALPFSSTELKPRQQILVGLLEDARVEALAMRCFPGLRRLWAPHLHASPLQGTGFRLLARQLTCALFDGSAEAGQDAWVSKGVSLFAAAQSRLHEPAIAIEIGLRLAHDIGQMRLPEDEHGLDSEFAYRDDNSHLWARVEALAAGTEEDDSGAEIRLPQGVFLEEANQGRELELADTASGQGGGLYLASQQNPVLAYRHAEPPAAVAGVPYEEWHYQRRMLRQDWCHVHDCAAPSADAQDLRAALQRQAPMIQRMQRFSRELRLERIRRLRGQKNGDEMDFNAALDALINMRRGREPEERIYLRSRPVHDGGLAGLLLLDLSASTARHVHGCGGSLLQAALEAVLVLSTVLQELHEALAIHGFCSNGRHDVRYTTLKAFDERLDDTVLERMAGAQGAFSTRMGTALRHGLAKLRQRQEYHRLLLLVTDGEPSDIDVFDHEYLLQDARDAANSGRRQGMQVFCVTLDSASETGVRRIFGEHNYLVVDRVERLDELLPKLFLRLVRHY